MERITTETLWCQYRVGPIGAKKVLGFAAVGFIQRPCLGCFNPDINTQDPRGVVISDDQDKIVQSVLVCRILSDMSGAEQLAALRVIKPTKGETIRESMNRHFNSHKPPENLP